jgi:uncharacterized protein
VFNTPFIKRIKTDNYSYIYDVNSNEIFRLNEIIYDIIDLSNKGLDFIVSKFIHKYNREDLVKYFNEIKKARKKNFYSDFRPEISSGIKSADDVKYLLKTGLKQIILDLTTRCNLRCKYCTFSGHYLYQRTHGNSDMTIEKAKKAIDFFIEKSKNNQNEESPAVTFYGGEPLLRFDLIKYVIELIKTYGLFEKYKYSLTTNGILLTDEVLDYFVKNNISILVSLDGSKDQHDRYRVFSNGRGTFDKIMRNLRKVKKYSEEYFERNISFNAVITPPYDFEKFIHFFFKNKLLSPIKHKMTINFVDSYATNFFDEYNLVNERRNLSKEMNKLLDKYKNALINGTYEKLTIEKHLFLRDFYNISARLKEMLDKKFPPLGSCVIGRRRLFVNTAGKFYMCEKVGENYEIGNINKGFDYIRIFNFYKKYDEFFEDCNYCWALRLCKKCFNNVNKKERLCKKRKEKLCEQIKKNIERNLIIYCEIIEKNPNAFEVFKGVKMT